MRAHWMPLLALAALACRTDDTADSDTAPVDTEPQDGDGDGSPDDLDCADDDPTIHPGAAELCDGRDQDCDGQVDEGAKTTFHPDADADGYGNPSLAVEGCEAPASYVTDATDCDDADGAVHPGAAEGDCTDPTDYNCDGSTGFADGDGDGVPACEDCDDADPTALPGGVETCDGADDDCDGEVDEEATDAATFYADADGDGYGLETTTTRGCSPPPGFAPSAGDCDDADAARNPSATELCNGVDDDCDTVVDDEPADAGTWYTDRDGDGYGASSPAVVACTRPDGAVGDGSDCDDTSAAVFPGGTEACDGVDGDCDGATLPGEVDLDGDGALACAECDDADPGVHPGAAETCNGADDDCDGEIDDDPSDEGTFYPDTDADGYGDDTAAVTACAAPTGYVEQGGDCDDASPAANPGADAGCGLEDLDCDGVTDGDADDDTFLSRACGGMDCDDGDAAKKPGVGGSCTTGLSCADVLARGFDANGLYFVDIDDTGPTQALRVYCEQKTDGGGWTLVMRTVWDEAETAQLMTNQADWFNKSYGSVGGRTKAFRLAGKFWPQFQDTEEHLFVHTLRRAADGTSCAPLYYKGTGGAYTVSTTQATTIDELPVGTSGVSLMNDRTAMSTTNSGPSQSCVTASKGVPWFYAGCCSTCPTFQGGYWTAPHPMQNYTATAKDLLGKTHAEACGTGTKAPITSSGYFGQNVMEYYIR